MRNKFIGLSRIENQLLPFIKPRRKQCSDESDLIVSSRFVQQLLNFSSTYMHQYIDGWARYKSTNKTILNLHMNILEFMRAGSLTKSGSIDQWESNPE